MEWLHRWGARFKTYNTFNHLQPSKNTEIELKIITNYKI